MALVPSCDSQVGKTETAGQTTGSQHILQGLDAGADLSDAGGTPVASSAMAVGTGDAGDLVFYAFTTDAPAASFPALSADAPTDNGVNDVFVAAVSKLSTRLDDGTEQPIAFTQGLRNSFRSQRCSKCHGFHTEDPTESTFTGHPGGLTTNANDGCQRCHLPDLLRQDGIKILDWRAPLVEDDFNFNNLSDEEICDSVASFEGLEIHFERDSRVLWAIQSGRLPSTRLADPNDPTSEIVPSDPRREPPLAVSLDQLSSQVAAWKRTGFVCDTRSATRGLALVSAAGGDEGDAASEQPGIAFVRSALPGVVGELFVVFQSDAGNLVAAPSGGVTHVYLARLAVRRSGNAVSFESLGTTRVSATVGGAAGDGLSIEPAISRSGSFVTFSSNATNLVSGFTDANGAAPDVFLWDYGTAEATLLSAGVTSTPAAPVGGNGRSGAPAINGDGRVVAFQSSASDLVTGDTNGRSDVFLVETNPVTRPLLVSADADIHAALATAGDETTPAIAGATDPDVFSDGSRTLVAYDAEMVSSTQHAYLFNLASRSVTLISRSLSSAGWTLANGDSRDVKFTPDGSKVVLTTAATNLDVVRPSDINGLDDVVLIDLNQFGGSQFFQTQRLSVSSEGDSGNLASSMPLVESFGSSLVVSYLTGAPADDQLLAPDGSRLANLGQSESSNVVFEFLGPLELSGKISDRLRAANQSPVCELTSTPTATDGRLTIEINNNVLFNGSQSTDFDTGDAVMDFEWIVNDATEANGETFDRTFDTLGEFDVTLRVTDTFGATDECSTVVEVVLPPPPVPAFRLNTVDCNSTLTPLDGQVDFNVSFHNCTTGVADTYLWDFGDGATSTLESPDHTYTTAGVYEVSLQATGIGGTATETQADLITVRPRADFSFLAIDDSPFTVQFTNASSGSPTAFSWNFGDGSSSTEESPTRIYASQQNYTVTLTVTRDSLMDSEAKLVAAPQADFSVDTTAGDADLMVNFTNSTSGAVTSYFWEFGDGATSTDETPSHTYTDAGVFEVQLTATGVGGSNTKDGVFITVDPVADFTASGTVGSAPFAVSFSDSSTGNPDTFSWDFGSSNLTLCGTPAGSNTSAQQDPMYTFPCAGTYTVSLTVSKGGRQDTVTKVSYITANSTVSYASDIHPIFASNGCTGSFCHDAVSPAAGLNLTGTAADTYPRICLRVDVDDPAQSLFYLNPTNLDPNGHGGGERFTPASTEAMNILDWIEACAPQN